MKMYSRTTSTDNIIPQNFAPQALKNPATNGSKITEWNLSQAYRFLSEVHKDIGNNYFAVCAFTPGIKGSYPHDILFAQSPDEALPFIKKHGETSQIYYSVAWQAEKKEGRQKGGIHDCIGGAVLWAEIDLDHPIKTEGKENPGKYPKDYEAVKEALSDLPAPSVVVFSGHGVHLLWLLQKPMTVEEHKLHDKANSLPKQWLRTVSYCMEKAGYTRPDATQNIDRILRTPGTFNLKDPENPVLAYIMEEESMWQRYDISYLKRFLVPDVVEESRKQVAAAVAVADDLVLSPDAEPPQDKFGQLRKSPKFRQLWDLQDPEKGADLSRYDMALVNMAIHKGWTDQEIADLLIAFRRKHAPHDDKVWSRDDYIPRTIAKARADSKVVALADKHKKSGQAHVDGNVVLFPNQDQHQNKTLGELFDDIPQEVAHLRMPKNWEIRNGMLTFWKTVKDVPVPEEVAEPIFVSRFLDAKNGGESKVELLYRCFGSWRTLIAERATVFSNQKIQALANKGVDVSSENARNIVRFLDAFTRLNRMEIPRKESVNHFGWVDKDFKTFIASPEDAQAQGLYLDLSDGMRKYAEALHEYGTLEGWIEGMKTYLAVDEEGQPAFPIARAVIDSYFASPLLPIIKQRPFVIHVYSNTGGGKTATAKLGASAWGNPEGLKIIFNSTQYFYEQVAGAFKHIPMFVDELQSVSRKNQNEVAEKFAYDHSLGQGKGRGRKNGDIREMHTWCNIANTTGERALTTDRSQGGAKNRALELYGKPIPDTMLASKAHIVAETNYGHAGKVFIQRVIEAGVEEVRKMYRDMTEQIMDLAEENSMQHISMISAIVLADYLVSQWLLGKTEDKAILEATNLAKYLIGNIESSANIDDSTRAKLFVAEWLFLNREHFNPASYQFRDKPYGNVTEDEIYVIPNVLNKALEDEDFEPTRIMRDWKEKGWIKTGEGKHMTMLKTLTMNWDGMEKQRQRVYVLKKDEFIH